MGVSNTYLKPISSLKMKSVSFQWCSGMIGDKNVIMQLTKYYRMPESPDTKRAPQKVALPSMVFWLRKRFRLQSALSQALHSPQHPALWFNGIG